MTNMVEALAAPGARPRPAARYAGFDVIVERAPGSAALALRWTRWLAAELAHEAAPLVPLGDEAVMRVAPRIASALGRLAGAAPFGTLRWAATRVGPDGRSVELVLDGPEGERVVFFVAVDGDRPRSGYRLEAGAASAPLAAGLRAMMEALSPRDERTSSAGADRGQP